MHSWQGVLEELDARRNDVSQALNQKTRTAMGQFFTPMPVARFMAGMFAAPGDRVSILDPGAGIGLLSAALISKVVSDAEASGPNQSDAL